MQYIHLLLFLSYAMRKFCCGLSDVPLLLRSYAKSGKTKRAEWGKFTQEYFKKR